MAKFNNQSGAKTLIERPIRYFNNPYNFVPLAKEVYSRYNLSAAPTADEVHEVLPSHGAMEDGLLSGEIHCTVTAQKPLSVSDGQKGFFRNAKGDYVIPGSTLKGLVRSNMQVLGFGAMRPGEDFNDSRLMYRVVATNADGVKASLAKDYKDTLGIRTIAKTNPETKKRSSYSVAEKVAAGYLVQRAIDKKYVIYPTVYYRISRTFGSKKEGKRYIFGPWEKKYTEVDRVWYQLNQKGFATKLVYRDKPQPDKTLPGLLVCTGRAVGKPNHLYLFPEFDPNIEPIELTDEEVMTYLTDFELRKNSLKGTDRNASMAKDYWKLPELKKGAIEDTKPWPVFYTDEGNPVYFGRSPFFRVGYHHSLKDGLPKPHQRVAEHLTLDYAYAMLGFTCMEPEVAYKSRVSFGDLVSDSKPLERTIPVVLSGPKPSSFADYSVKGKDFNQNDFRIRGVKQYWLKEPQCPEVSPQQANVKDELKVMPENTRFTGVIRFNNLHEDELGLLLWCLKLNDGCYQTIGKGKPLGYGRSTVSIDAVERYLPKNLYSADCLTGSASVEHLDAVSLIAAYQEYIAKAHLNGEQPENQPSVRDFLHIHSVIREAEQVRYLTFKEYQSRQQKEYLPTIEDQRQNPKCGQRELRPLKTNTVLEGKVLHIRRGDDEIDIKLTDYDLIGVLPFYEGRYLKQSNKVKVKITPYSSLTNLKFTLV